MTVMHSNTGNSSSSSSSHRTTVSNSPALDRPIKATADDAILAKLAAVQAGYYSDPFLDAFSQGSVGISAGGGGGSDGSRMPRRNVQPIIKRGTHARVCVMDRAVSAFTRLLAGDGDRGTGGGGTVNDGPPPAPTPSSPCQVVVLGAGKDTAYFRYLNGNIMGMEEAATTPPSDRQEGRHRQVRWYDVDHMSVIQEKASLIRRSNLLSNFCPELVETEHGFRGGGCRTGGASASASSCHWVGHDLRDPPAELLEKLDLDRSLPTLFLMECVSMYVPIDASRGLLRALASAADDVWLVCYEPILGDPTCDPFGRVMEQNLVRAGVARPESCLIQTRTLPQQLEKLVRCGGFRRAVGCDMWAAYETVVTDAQRRRANQSEFLDEHEEWVLIMRHYCFVAARGGRSSHEGEQSGADLTAVGKERGASPLGFTTGKCLVLEQGWAQPS